MFIVYVVLCFSVSLQAHESCEDDLAFSYAYYEKTINFINQGDSKYALYYAKMFQLEAYEFKLMCGEKKLNTDIPFADIVTEHKKIEDFLFEEKLLKAKMLH